MIDSKFKVGNYAQLTQNLIITDSGGRRVMLNSGTTAKIVEVATTHIRLYCGSPNSVDGVYVEFDTGWETLQLSIKTQLRAAKDLKVPINPKEQINVSKGDSLVIIQIDSDGILVMVQDGISKWIEFKIKEDEFEVV